MEQHTNLNKYFFHFAYFKLKFSYEKLLRLLNMEDSYRVPKELI